jgi:CheY-like chemotaxis protein
MVGDPTRLRQTLLNLVGNAVKFTKKGAIEIHVQALSSDPALLRFEVHDTGIGIPADKQSLLFKEFSQLDSSTTRRFGGTGLGLAISSRLVKLMGGQIGHRSEPGQGTMFWFTLPLATIQKTCAEDAPTQGSVDLHRLPATSVNGQPSQRHSLGANHASRCGDLSPPPEIADGRGNLGGHSASLELPATAPSKQPSFRVLVVEDDATNQVLAAHLLKRLSCQVDIAENGLEAVALAAERVYDAIFMDCLMPEMDGWEATKRIRQFPNASGRVPIVAVTACVGAGQREKCLASGMDDFLEKPIQIEALERALQTWTLPSNGKRHQHSPQCNQP